MLGVRTLEFGAVSAAISKIAQPPLKYLTLDERQRRDALKPANEALEALIEKAVGSNIEDQAGWLLHHVKKLYPRGSFLTKVIDDYKELQDYSTISADRRKNYRKNQYKTFYKVVEKMSGSKSMSTHRKFFEGCYAGMHGEKQDFKQLTIQPSWKVVLAMVKQLESNNPSVSYFDLTERQARRRRQVQLKVLDELIKISAGSADADVQVKLLHDRLEKMNRGFKPYS